MPVIIVCQKKKKKRGDYYYYYYIYSIGTDPTSYYIYTPIYKQLRAFENLREWSCYG